MRYLVGKRFGRLVVVEQFGSAKNRVIWRCVCDCGATDVLTNGNILQRGKKQSCGCAVSEMISAAKRVHGQAGGKRTSAYERWTSIKKRCLNPNSQSWPNYGARGIGICDRWANSFEAFYADVGDAPEPYLTLDRIDNEGDYEPGNVRWATRVQQAGNRREADRNGMRNGRAKLTEEDVRFIRASSASGVSLAEMLGVTPTQVSDIRRGKSWRHIP